jgi:rod shape-determining protein MreC
MQDKAVRRRRAVLAALVALSLALLTAYFGESTSGGLHAVQRGAMEVLAPIQEGANKAIKPFRDLFRWAGDTLDAKDRADRLAADNARLEQEVAELEVLRRQNRELAGLREMTSALDLGRYDAVRAEVFSRSPSTWYSTVEINKGSRDGLEKDQPVINGQGLVGKVQSVTAGSAIVMLLTDEQFGVAAMTSSTFEPGTITPAVGAPGDLLMDLVQRPGRVRQGDRVVTAGTTTPRLTSLFPKGILIGRVKRIDEGEGDLDRKIHVRPAADLRRLDVVEVLTRPHADLRAQVGAP